MKIITKRQDIFTNKIFVMVIAVLCTALWGNMIPSIQIGFFLFDIAADHVFSQILFAGICFTLSGVFSLIYLIINRKNGYKSNIFPKKSTLWNILLLGFIQTSLQYILLYIGLPHTSGFNASIISSSGTFFIIILSHFIYKNDKINLYKIIGCVLGIFGVVLLNLISFCSLCPTFTIKGEGMIFLSTLTFVFTTPLCKELSKNENVTIFTGYSFIFGGIPLIIIGLINKGTLNFNLYSCAMLLYLSFAATFSGILWNYLLKYNKISEVSIYNFLVPVFGAISSLFMFGENIFEIKNLCALFLTCIGIYCTEKEEKHRKSIRTGENYDYKRN